MGCLFVCCLVGFVFGFCVWFLCLFLFVCSVCFLLVCLFVVCCLRNEVIVYALLIFFRAFFLVINLVSFVFVFRPPGVGGGSKLGGRGKKKTRRF